MFGAMIHAAERWRLIKIGAFEQRQMEAVRKELDPDYGIQTSLAQQSSKDANTDKLSSSSRT